MFEINRKQLAAAWVNINMRLINSNRANRRVRKFGVISISIRTSVPQHTAPTGTAARLPLKSTRFNELMVQSDGTGRDGADCSSVQYSTRVCVESECD